MNNKNVGKVISLLKKETKKLRVPIVTEISWKKSPYRVLISCLLSLRTKDSVTAKASNRLFAKADNPKALLKLSKKEIEKLIFPVSFYKTKAKMIKEISKILIKKYKGKVPDDLDELLKLKGVGRKTANIVVTLAFKKPGIAVDTHVHRISNRLGYVKTKSPEKTEFALRKKLPRKYWLIYNDLLVAWGQFVCVPISPFCSKCTIRKYCDRVNVKKSR